MSNIRKANTLKSSNSSADSMENLIWWGKCGLLVQMESSINFLWRMKKKDSGIGSREELSRVESLLRVWKAYLAICHPSGVHINPVLPATPMMKNQLIGMVITMLKFNSRMRSLERIWTDRHRIGIIMLLRKLTGAGELLLYSGIITLSMRLLILKL